MPKDKSTQILKDCNLKVTAGREALLNVLLGAGKALSHKEICSELVSLRYDPVSIYRSLESFMEAGIVHRVEDENRTWLFALCTCDGGNHCHPHFFCRSCGKCECLKEYKMPEIIGLQDSYVVEEKRFYIKGICGGCSRPAEPRKN